ncbi:MAG: plasmid pRiA4b ORF-3 family protein [Pseudomonas sp.]|nr:plasmid pRiA4b ORF-3 family protein [Pseudomonas sp.]
MLITLPLPLPLWRCIRVSGDGTLRKLHHFIQAAMGWNSSHLHQFSLGEQRFMPPDLGFPEPGVLDDRKHKLRRLLKQGDRLRYIYDLGDCWQHVIAAEAVEPAEVAGTWGEVLAGARA